MGDDVDFAAMEFVHIFNTAVTYKVTSSSKSSTLGLPDSFTIQDVRPSDIRVPMIVHILPTTAALCEFTIILTSLDGNELRVYTIDCLQWRRPLLLAKGSRTSGPLSLIGSWVNSWPYHRDQRR